MPDASLPPFDTVAAVICDAAGRVLLVRKRGTATFIQPGGKREPGESWEDCLIRELREAPRLLQDWDLIEPVAEGYRFRVEILRQWVARNKPLRRTQSELDYIEPAAENLYRAARNLYQAGQLEQSVGLLRQALSINPNHARASELLADILLSQGTLQEARTILELLFEQQPGAARHRLVQVLVAQAEAAHESDQDEALRCLDRVLQLDPGHSAAQRQRQQIWRTRGDRARQAGNLEQALRLYESGGLREEAGVVAHQIREGLLAQEIEKVRALGTRERYTDALALVRDLESRFGPMEALSAAEGWLQQQSDLAFRYQRARAALQDGDTVVARSLLIEIIQIEPDYREATRYLHMAVTGVDVQELMDSLVRSRNAAEVLLQQAGDGRKRLEEQLAEENASIATSEPELVEELASSRAVPAHVSRMSAWNRIFIIIVSAFLIVLTCFRYFYFNRNPHPHLTL